MQNIDIEAEKIYNFFYKSFAKTNSISIFATRCEKWIKKAIEMKKDLHPDNYRLVAFKDMSNEHVFITRSAAPTKETIEVEGVEYPLFKLEISNTSHPFYTGKMKLVDTAGRVDKFMNRYKKHMDNRAK